MVGVTAILATDWAPVIQTAIGGVAAIADGAFAQSFARPIDLILSAIYNLQAAFEAAMGAVSFSPDRDETKDARKEFLELASSKVRYLFLIDVLRSHDFHRHAVTFRTGGMGVYGPIKIARTTRAMVSGHWVRCREEKNRIE